MRALLRNEVFILFNKTILHKILYTVGVVMLFLLGTFTPLPAVSFVSNESNTMTRMLDLVSGGTLLRFGLFALGLTPYITASLMIQLLTQGISPYHKKLSELGASGQSVLNKHTKLITLGIATLQALGFILNNQFSSVFGVFIPTRWDVRLTVMVLLVTGAMIVAYLAELINLKGLGHGVSILISVGILMSLPKELYHIYNLHQYYIKNNTVNEYYVSVAILVASLIFVGVLAYKTNKKVYPIAIQSKNHDIELKAINFPLKLMASSIVPVIFATSLFAIITVVASLANLDTTWLNNTYIYHALLVAFIVYFTFAYNHIQLDPKKLVNDLNRSNVYLVGKANPEEYLSEQILRISKLAAFWLAVMALVPMFVELVSPITFGASITGISVFLLVSSFTEILSFIDAHRIRDIEEGGTF